MQRPREGVHVLGLAGLGIVALDLAKEGREQGEAFAIRGGAVAVYVPPLRRGRGVAVVMALSLGVGANLAVFSVVYTALMRPLPHPNPDRLVSISSRDLASGRDQLTAPLDFFDLEQRTTSFDRLGAYYPPGFTLTGNGPAERVAGARDRKSVV